MKSAVWMVAMGLALTSCGAFAQTPAEQPAPAAAAAQPAEIPADQQATKEQLQKLFEVMRIRQQMQSLTQMMPTLVERQMRQQMQAMAAKETDGKGPTPEQQEAMAQVMKNYMEKAMNIYPVEQMLDDMSAVYQRHVSRADVDAFIAFYSSPAGQHLLDAQPAIMREFMPMVMQNVQERSKAMREEMVQAMEAIFKTQSTPADAAPAPPAPAK